MVVTIIANKVKSFVLFFVTLFRRALCCFRRRRRISCDVVPLTDIGVISNEAENEVENWHDWGRNNFINKKPESIQDHIELYRQQKAVMQANEETAEDVTDFFENMTPKITKQKKIVINTGGSQAQHTNNLSLVPDPRLVGKELGEWEENTGWEGEALDWDAQEALKEKKRQERQKRAWEQQQRRLERTNRPVSSTARISA